MNSGKCGRGFVAEGKLNLALEHDACGEVFYSLGTSHCPRIPEHVWGVHPNPTPPHSLGLSFPAGSVLESFH